MSWDLTNHEIVISVVNNTMDKSHEYISFPIAIVLIYIPIISDWVFTIVP